MGGEAQSVPPGIALDALPAGVIVVDGGGTIRYANRFAATLHAWATPSLVGERVDVVLAPMGQLRRGARDEDGRGEVTLRDAKGNVRTMGYSLGACDVGGVHHDVVLYQRIDGMQEIRTQRDRLLQLAAVGDVLPSVLHELRNPLAAVTALVEVLVEEAPEALRLDLHAVLGELRRLGLGLQGIGGLKQSVHGRGAEAIDMAIEEAVKVLAPSARALGVTLRTDVSVMALLPLDRSAVKGLVFNLVRNAIDACRPGDEVVVAAKVVGDEFEMSVSDTGRGMTTEVLARCTELFFTSKINGSGIGLAICRQVVERARGTLSIASEPGAGTTVLARIPLAAPGDP